MKRHSDYTYLQRLQQGEDAALKELYKRYRTPFIHWISQRNHLSIEDAKEIFQISMIALYENAINGKLQQLNSTLYTYICAIGKHKASEWMRLQQRQQFDITQLLLHDEIEESTNKQTQEKQILQVQKALKNMGGNCQKLLENFYFYKNSMREIAQKMNYSNESTVKTAKYKCLQRLKKLVRIPLLSSK